MEDSLREVEMCYGRQMEQLNGILLHQESELAQGRATGKHRATGQCQAQKYTPC